MGAHKTLKHKPKDGSTHWSSCKLAAELGDVSFSAVQRVWRKHGLKPHRLERDLVTNDPDFETKAADVIGPPAHAAVFCADEKTVIQVLIAIGSTNPLRNSDGQRPAAKLTRGPTRTCASMQSTEAAAYDPQLEAEAHVRR